LLRRVLYHFFCGAFGRREQQHVPIMNHSVEINVTIDVTYNDFGNQAKFMHVQPCLLHKCLCYGFSPQLER
jgi:hypothetical protein